ncbi:FTR1 family iron permease [Fodinisporobacter ferrooxydans]|uniref:FTR1 family iron permease n=1 Tax=Fodinisporobacter ferrooxydans TaxID=2901836 RepID=A0ABY4CF01_9BACL|nr:FTR1 family iron permease [Alicyclobacillaceae bacterium MYW30-H2]
MRRKIRDRKISRALFLFVLAVVFILPISAQAASQGTENLTQAETIVDKALSEANQGHLSQAKDTYQKFPDMWLKIEDSVKTESGQAYSDIELNMGQVDYALIQNKQPGIVKALQGLKDVNERFIHGQYAKGEQFKKESITLGDFLNMLQETKKQTQNHDQQAALQDIGKVRQSWLSVEGVVVAQSASIYGDSERDMVTINAMIAAGNDQGAAQILDRMIQYLTPLATKTGYTIWDAAMIPIREGLEALLVVAALLAFVKKSNQSKGKVWIWSGVFGGLGVSAILAVVVKLVFSSGAFGNNNFLISGWTGVIAAAMLLYMAYWLHSQSNIKDWQKYLRTQSQSAVDTGRLVSLGVLSFLAVFREGTETVLFIIGMINQISIQNLILGLLLGLGILAVLAFLMLVVGIKLPMRPFFMVSSFIVFYLCLKFTGMGIHSLQLAGTLPSTTAPLPSVDFIALYPSWESSIPQILLVLFALCMVFWKNRPMKWTKKDQHQQITVNH